MRKYIRHPAQIPIDVSVESSAKLQGHTKDVALGGLCFEASHDLPPGCRIQLRINVHNPFKAQGIVVWCRPSGDHFDVGVQFDDDYTKYAIRMVEQVCWIEDYRRKVLEEDGRNMTTDEAAAEWITRYAGRFEDLQESYPEMQ